MDEEHATRFRAVLEILRQELRASLESNDEATNPVSPDRAIGRLTRQDAMLAQQMALELKRRNQVRLSQVEQALRRVEAGTYGICARCEDEISVARLEVRPEAPFCVECAGGAARR
jgi:DnaK suppressor protein